MDTRSIIAALDPCRSDLAALGQAEIGAPGFGEPWHAQVFGIAMAAAQAGLFSWGDWVATFSAEIRANPQASDETSEEAYYRQWAAALATILAATGAAEGTEIEEAAEHWRRSYIATEHGKPIRFRRDLPAMEDAHPHHHHHHGHGKPAEPVAVSTATA
ncbi:nitrile hydratase accessory protein [Mangrovicoccus sp. HB161399]|uniref:nitrile hydratase accessory protein n=1 Tax=Mangrovicoccus sp. HB161399 TaxID=2720392 RepID=UPI00155249B5|nr:nitrile hydratase accessory protein [Mangrovicoccus sp. HB161399]